MITRRTGSQSLKTPSRSVTPIHTFPTALLLETSLGCVQYDRETKYQGMETKIIGEVQRASLAKGEDQNGVYHTL